MHAATRIGPFCCFATGLGLVAYDAEVVRDFVEGPGFGHPQGQNHAALEAAMSAARAVLLTTGEPQRDYLVQVFLEPAPGEAPEGLHIAVGFPLVVESGTLCLRDAYELMDWETDAVHVVQVPVPAGRYFVELLRIDDPNGLFVLHLHLTAVGPEDELPPSDGWVDLF
jgi:hypothetical protein